MFAPSRLASSFALCVFAAVAMSACGSSPTTPGSTGHVVIHATIHSEGSAPALGSVVRLSVDVRDASGTSVLSLLTVPVTEPDGSFRVDLDAPAGDGEEVTVLAIGDRPVVGNPNNPDDAGIGVIYRGAMAGVNVHARSTTSQDVTLDVFVPQFQPLEVVGSGVRISWTAEAGVEAYQLTRIYDNVGLTTTAVAGTSFIDDTGASRYQILAVEKGGRLSAPSDFLAGQ